MDTRLFRYLFENTSNAIVMTGCTWDRSAQEQIRYAYSCEMSHNNWRISRLQRKRQMSYGGSPINLFVMGAFSIEDIERLIQAVHYSGVDTLIIPYVTPIQRSFALKTLRSRGIEDPEVERFIRSPYLYLQESQIKNFYFIYGNGQVFQKTDEEMYPGYHLEMQEDEILDIVEEMEGYRIPVRKAGYIIDNRMLFYLGYFGADLRMVRHFMHHYEKSGQIGQFGDRQMQKMMLVYLKEFGDPRMDSLTLFCSPVEIITTQTDCVLNTIVVDKEDFCHADIEADEGRCTLKCMLYNDYDVCRCHRTEEAELRAGVLLLGNIKLNKYLTKLRQRYDIVDAQIRALSVPNCGHIQNWDSKFADQNPKKNSIFWLCALQAQTSDRVLREIKEKNARYRIIGLNEGYGCCINGFLTEKTM